MSNIRRRYRSQPTRLSCEPSSATNWPPAIPPRCSTATIRPRLRAASRRCRCSTTAPTAIRRPAIASSPRRFLLNLPGRSSSSTFARWTPEATPAPGLRRPTTSKRKAPMRFTRSMTRFIAARSRSIGWCMTETERVELENLSRSSDSAAHATLISTRRQRDRNPLQRRPPLSRRQQPRRNPPTYRLNLPSDNNWNGVTAINLNSQYTYNQIVGSAIFQTNLLPAADATAVQLRLNGTDPGQSRDSHAVRLLRGHGGHRQRFCRPPFSE